MPRSRPYQLLSPFNNQLHQLLLSTFSLSCLATYALKFSTTWGIIRMLAGFVIEHGIFSDLDMAMTVSMGFFSRMWLFPITDKWTYHLDYEVKSLMGMQAKPG